MYNLHQLGWNSFQQLCLTIVREVIGQTVEAFLDSNDGGRDGAFAGTWNPTGLASLTGHFVIQCKYTNSPDYSLSVADLSDELAKVTKLVSQGLCDSYVLMTNAKLTGKRSAEIEVALKAVGVQHTAVLGSTWIEQQILEHKRLRMLVPRVYGLGDLSQILDERAYSQARAILNLLREDLAKVVVTDAYRRAAASLDKHSFVLLIGEPAAGKTTIASLLAMAAVDQWKAAMLKLDDPKDVVTRWNPHEPSQFFWLDDAFGVAQYEWSLANSWNHIFPQVKTMLRQGAKIVMTSRDYIYNGARKDLKEGAFPLFRESQVVIDVQDLANDEKRQILYNHIKLGRQPPVFRKQVKRHLESIATHGSFIPETARRLADPLFTQALSLDAFHVGQFVEKREHFLREVLQGLDRDSKAALALIYMRNDRLESPVTLQASEQDALERLGSNLGGCVVALEALKGSLVLHVHADGDSIWRFKHPTIGDAYAAILADSPDLLGIFVHGSASDKLIEQVTCGDVGIEKAVILPRSLFPLMLDRLRNFSTSRFKSASYSAWAKKSAVQRFLAHRCSKEFLLLYLQSNPTLFDDVSEPGLYLDTVSEVDLALRLHTYGMLPDENRRRFVAKVSEYAIRGDDLDALSNRRMASIFEPNELANLIDEVRIRLIPRLDEVRRSQELGYSVGNSPEAHMYKLLESLDTLSARFSDDAQVIKVVEAESARVREWIDEKAPEEAEIRPRSLGEVDPADEFSGTRSIFDDIDS